jgi:NADH dehydrogenase FAD-containing subunit
MSGRITVPDAAVPDSAVPQSGGWPRVPRRVCAAVGAAAGLVTGLIVAAVQVWQGMMAVGLVGAEPAAPGLGLALLLAVVAGAGFGVVVGYRPRGYAAAIATGLLLGLLWWLVESLTVLPVLAGRPVTWSLADAQATFGFGVGSLLYGGLTGLGVHLGLAGYVRARPPTATKDRPRCRVVVLGGGFAGVGVAQRLERRLARRPEVEVVLVSESNFLLFTPMLAGVAAGVLQARHISAPVRAACPNTVFHKATVARVDVDRRVVLLRPGAGAGGGVDELGYDHLVLALGAVPNYRGLPGVAEHAWALKTLDDAVRLREHVLGLLERADVETDPVERRRQLTFVVAGGGFAGTELVAELCDMVHDVRRYYPRLDPAELRFVLVHGQDRILPELDPGLAAYALGRLRGKGIEFLLSAAVAQAIAGHVVLADGQVIPTRTLVWTAGNRPNPLLAALPFAVARTGAVACEPTLRVSRHLNVWAVGDCAAIPDPDEPSRFYPPTAQHALREGKAVADNIVAALRGRPPRPFRHRSIGVLVALGHQQGAAQIRGRRFAGRLAWLLWRSVYLGKLPGLEKKLRVALDWTLDMFFPRDVVLTKPTAAATQVPEPSGGRPR